MRFLAIPATNSPTGLNRRLLQHAARVLEGGLVPDAEVEVIDLDDYEMPIYSKAREVEQGVPDHARRLLDRIGGADAVLISFAEHNGSYTAAWKNVFDWVSRVDRAVFGGKPLVAFAATPGPRGGAGVLAAATATLPRFGASLVGSLGIPSFSTSFDSEAGELVDEELRTTFESLLVEVADAAANANDGF